MVKVDDLVGLPFVNGGRDPDVGLDCWGLVMAVFKRYGVDLMDFAVDAFAFRAINTLIGEATISVAWEEVYKPCDGDAPLVVLIRIHPILVTHAGVFIGHNRVIHTIENTNTVISKVGVLGNHIVGYYRRCSQL